MTTKPAAPTLSEVQALYDLLRPGKASAISARDLSRQLGLDDRAIRNLAEFAPQYGPVICSGNNGYWRVQELSDIDETCARLESQAARMFERSRKLKDMAAQLLVQDRML